MWHLDIPKTRQYDHGKVEVVARNSLGEVRVETALNVITRQDDYRGVLKTSPRRESPPVNIVSYNTNIVYAYQRYSVEEWVFQGSES
jgi:hypothetical protein